MAQHPGQFGRLRGGPAPVRNKQRQHRYPPGMRVAEHWWDQSWSTLWRRDIWLLEDGGQWSLRARVGDREKTLDYRDEADARTQLALWLAEEDIDWIRIDDGA